MLEMVRRKKQEKTEEKGEGGERKKGREGENRRLMPYQGCQTTGP